MKNYMIPLAFILMFSITACQEDNFVDEIVEEEEIIDNKDYADWTDETHSKSADLNYSVVFNQNKLLRFDIKISSEDWINMQSDLSSILGSAGGRPGGPGGGMGGADVSTDPMWVPCSFKFNDTEWYHVGIRYKGNSSLKSTYQSGNKKLSFKLDFDQFEDDYPEIENQRFYGFKQLNLKNNFDDVSLMREKVGADLFRQFGLASSETAFCEVYVDNGSGPQYYGIYTLVEEVDNTVIKSQFINNSGNLYKPDGNAASFANGTFNTNQMEIKTNEDSATYADVRALYDIINGTERTTNTENWITNLESVFNVDLFLKYLAANNVIQNWDTYGIMTHNYYLYNNPEDGLLTWIPWDNNEAFQDGKQGGALSLSMSEVRENWPLIRYILDQPEYKATYEVYLQQFVDEVFIPSKMISLYSTYYDLLKDYAYAEQSGYTFIRSDSDFDMAVETLKTHVQSRNNVVSAYLN